MVVALRRGKRPTRQVGVGVFGDGGGRVGVREQTAGRVSEGWDLDREP